MQTFHALLGLNLGDATNCHSSEDFQMISNFYATQYFLALRLNQSLTLSQCPTFTHPPAKHFLISKALTLLHRQAGLITHENRDDNTHPSITLVPFKAKGHRLLSYICFKATRPTKDSGLGKHRVQIFSGEYLKLWHSEHIQIDLPRQWRWSTHSVSVPFTKDILYFLKTLIEGLSTKKLFHSILYTIFPLSATEKMSAYFRG